MQFINDTNYDTRSLSALTRMSLQAIDAERKRLHRILCIIFGAFGLALGIYLQMIGQKESMLPSIAYLYGILFLFIGILWYPFHNYISKWTLSQGIKRYHYEFDDEDFYAESQVTGSHYQYCDLYAICENEHWYALFLDNKHGMILDKSGFCIGDPNMFASFLTEKSGLTIIKV